ncbi:MULTISPECIES: hypothetical protein [unclassified Meiothermus]|uniref:hypothetical protein n=1 Tax=unclassified Meiothermus TaxID=370471 RepID=UPI000D7C3FC4|nr:MULTISPECIES: hypothetical protein [unclassified Meiothermus]PZA07054.1 hypothetical protein DNA98_10385 [Meiothermus sp. Pnk-1]RYM40070.1 hypothetical protein EWH23_02545 [Meiothermus sp. PNK-Is4]
MQLDEYIETLGEAYACLGRPRLEGRLVALLLASPRPIALGEAAQVLGVTKNALLKLLTPMTERGDVMRTLEPSTRRHLFALTDHAFIHDLRTEVVNRQKISEATLGYLKSTRGLPPHAKSRLRGHAEFTRRLAQQLGRVLKHKERELAREMEEHLEKDWYALPPHRKRWREHIKGELDSSARGG